MIATDTYTEQIQHPLAGLDSRDQTLASIIHELNNPLTTILGLSELVLEDSPSPDHRVARIRAEAERSVRIIRNMLDLCRLGPDRPAGPVFDGRTPVDLNEAIRHGAALAEDQLDAHGIALTVELPWRSPKVHSRPGELTQVFLNLITNSIQAISSTGRPGAITILGTQLGKRVCITVEDDGPGVNDQDFDRLFQPFFTTKGQGTGLGLNLSRKIVQAIGGELWASRNPERGAIFTVEVPVEESPSDVRNNADDGRRKLKTDLSVLVVDDEEHIVDLVRTVLERKGFKIEVATQSDLGLTMLQNRDYDLLVCDYHMPGVDGRAFLKWVQGSGKNTRVLALSGDVMQDDTRQFIERHHGLFLAKPFTIGDLLGAVERLLVV